MGLYAGAFAPALPNRLIEMADTILGKLVFIFLIGYLATDRQNMQLAIMVAVAFVVTLTVVNKNKINEAYSNYEYFSEDHKDLESENKELRDALRNIEKALPGISFPDTEPEGS